MPSAGIQPRHVHKGEKMIRLFSALAPILLSASIMLGNLSAALPTTPSSTERISSTPTAMTPLLHAMQLPGGGSAEGVPGAAPDATFEGTSEAASIEASPPADTNPDGPTTPTKPTADEEMRGLWVASVVNIDWPKNPTTSAIALRLEADAALDFAQEHRFNAIFLQIRPTADSLFPSDYFPWSKYLTGTTGTPPEDGFDPLAYWIEQAHERGIELHAWLNPYRITKKAAADPAVSLDQLPATHPARLHPDWTVKFGDNLYFNPGLPEVRQLLMNSIGEIISRYDVDGIHFDDYFYPDGSATKNTAAAIPAGAAKRGFFTDKNNKLLYASAFDDSTAFLKYGTAYARVDDWRRANVDTFVRETGLLVKQLAPEVRYGISPFGIWRNKDSDALGSATRGAESYTAHAADTRKWVKMGWVDYIVPQIYWNIGYTIADYKILSDWWTDVVKDTGVDLYVGQAAYRMDADSIDSAWYGVSELEKQEALNRANPAWAGSIFFSYQSFLERPGLAAALRAMREAQDGLSTPLGGGLRDAMEMTGATGGTPPKSAEAAAKQSREVGSGALMVARTASSTRTGAANQYFTGASNPDKPLYLNGEEVLNRSENGYFGVYRPLTHGKNTFVFSQDGVYLTRTIWRNKPVDAAAPAKMATIGIPAASAYPQSPLYGQPGETYVLSCTAPIGAKVTVKVGGQTYNMTPATTKSPGSGAYPTTYKLSWVMPKQTGTPRVVDAGAPLYTMTYLGKTHTRSAPAKIGIVMRGAPFYAVVNNQSSESYDGMTTSGGTRYYLDKGGRDTVTGMVGEWVRLGSGLFVRKNTVTIAKAPTVIQAYTNQAVYEAGYSQDQFRFALSTPTIVTADFDGKALMIRVPLATAIGLPVLPENSLFASVSGVPSGSGFQYVFQLKENTRLEGYMLERTADGYVVSLKRHIKATPGGPPLLGKTILLDPGHGGTKADFADGDTGAIGPLGTLWSERNINLSNAYVLKAQLEKLGAKVILSRTEDVPLSLAARLNMSRTLRPDMFISLHADSLDDSADISKVSGFSVWYRDPVAQDIGTRVLRKVVDEMGLRDRRLNQRNFYVVRGTWAPSFLIEAGFVPNTDEFEKMLDPAYQKQMMDHIASAIVDYYTQ
jgi:uncharacterized lipoprotein YddW (UPF0748 family)/N-acetylmuramoyl-L-alanine amidase